MNINSVAWQNLRADLKPAIEYYDKKKNFYTYDNGRSTKYNTFVTVCRYLDKKIDIKEPDYKSIENNCNKLYPMIQYLCDTVKQNVVEDYIQLIDTKGV